MKSSGWTPAILSLAILTGIATSACSSTFVVVPGPASQYTTTDTLYATHNGEDVRVTFHFDTITRVDTIMRVDTAWVEGSRLIVRVDTVLRVDTMRTSVTDTVVRTRTILRTDTVRVPTSRTVVRVDTIQRVDTIRVAMIDTLVRTDTIMRVDTLRIAVTDTVFRTVPIPGRRVLFVPPGHYPPEGLCRIWIHNVPPGRQSKPAACDALGEIPNGAFVLFGGDAWDFDYDWIAEAESNPGTIPPVILALKRRT